MRWPRLSSPSTATTSGLRSASAVVEEAEDATELVRLGAQTAERQRFTAYSADASERRLRELDGVRVDVARTMRWPCWRSWSLASTAGPTTGSAARARRARTSCPRTRSSGRRCVAAARDELRRIRPLGRASRRDPTHPAWRGLWQFKSGFNVRSSATGSLDLVLSAAGVRMLSWRSRAGASPGGCGVTFANKSSVQAGFLGKIFTT